VTIRVMEEFGLALGPKSFLELDSSTEKKYSCHLIGASLAAWRQCDSTSWDCRQYTVCKWYRHGPKFLLLSLPYIAVHLPSDRLFADNWHLGCFVGRLAEHLQQRPPDCPLNKLWVKSERLVTYIYISQCGSTPWETGCLSRIQTHNVTASLLKAMAKGLGVRRFLST
jgi:hypothetical protein